jgi:hypothetical protein
MFPHVIALKAAGIDPDGLQTGERLTLKTRETVRSRPATSGVQAEGEEEMSMDQRRKLPTDSLDLDTAIRLRWALRDIKVKRTKMTPVSQSDLRTLLEMRLIEMRDDVPALTIEGERAIDRS